MVEVGLKADDIGAVESIRNNLGLAEGDFDLGRTFYVIMPYVPRIGEHVFGLKVVGLDSHFNFKNGDGIHLETNVCLSKSEATT